MAAYHRENIVRGRLSAGVAMTVLALAQAAPAMAQDTAAPATTAAAPASTAGASSDVQGAQIVVTGTRIANAHFKSPTPITTISTEQIQNQSPSNNLADLVNQMPALAGSTRPSNSRLALSSGVAGINALNLRQLGENRTLVMLDGHREVPSSVTGLVDINTIPQQLVKQVDIVTGGASAAYGSDAVAGVVNFVLDKDFTGLKVSADSGISTYGDAGNYSFQAAGGFKFAGDRGHVLLSGEYAHQDGVFDVDRKWNARGERIIANPDYTATNGQPFYITRSPVGTNNALPGGIINSSTNGNALRGIYFGENGSVNHYDYGTLTSSTNTVGGDYALSDNGRNIGLAAEDDRRNVYARVSYEFAPWITAYAEGSYSWNETRFNAGPQLTTSRVLQSDNAYLIDALGPNALAPGQTATLGTTASDLPYRETNNRRDVQRYLAGLEGHFDLFGKPAYWSAYGQYGVTHTHELLVHVLNNNALSLGTDAVFAPAGNALGVAAGTIVCRSSLTNPTNGCQPIDFLGTNVVSSAAKNYVLGNPYRDEKLQEKTAGVNLSVTPFATWAGDVSVAVGAEYRKEQVSGFVPTEYQSGWSVGNFLPTFGSYNVKEAYLETAVPLGLGIVFNGAVRATDYSTSGYVTTWKAGATWQPIQDIRFRVTQSRDIRAPNLNELFAGGTSRSDSLTDPFPTPGFPNGGESKTFVETTTGNPNLKPEKADTTVVGAVLTPRFLSGFSLSADYFHIKLKDAIGQVYSQDIINFCAQGLQQFCSAYGPDPAGNRDFAFKASPFNFSRITTSGIDLDLSYQFPIDRIFPTAKGSLTFAGNATHYIKNVVDTGLSPAINTAGSNETIYPPSWIYRFSVTYDTPTFSVTGIGRGVSSGHYLNNYIQCTSGCPAYNTNFPTIDDNHVSGTFYVDANITAKVGSTLLGDAQVFLNVTDLFNASPLLLPESGLAANSTYSDLLGRTFRVGVRFNMR